MGSRNGVTVASTVDDAHRSVRRAADSHWVDWGARLGLTARGVVYLLIGLIALQVARGGGEGEQANKEGALREIAERSWGGVLLVVLAVGLAGYALWRATEALWGHRDEDDDRKRTAKRLGSAARAVFYGVFCFTTVRFIVNGPSAASGGETDEKTFVGRVLELPAGQWIVGAAGAAIIGGAVYIGYRGFTGKFEKRLDTSDMGRVMGPTVDVLGTVGLGGPLARVRARRLPPHPGRHRLQPGRGQRPRRHPQDHGPATLRPAPPRRHRDRADGLRPVLLGRGPLPPALTRAVGWAGGGDGTRTHDPLLAKQVL